MSVDSRIDKVIILSNFYVKFFAFVCLVHVATREYPRVLGTSLTCPVKVKLSVQVESNVLQTLATSNHEECCSDSVLYTLLCALFNITKPRLKLLPDGVKYGTHEFTYVNLLTCRQPLLLAFRQRQHCLR